MPLVMEGTASIPGPALLEPRDPSSPFWVNWDNREASIISFLFTFNPTPGTPFYKYEPTILEEWNLNPKEAAPISFAAKYSLKRYFTGTDRLYYSDANGNTVWEGPTLTEPWATDGYLGDFTFFAKVQTDDYHIIFNVSGGDSLATNAFSYIIPPPIGKPITAYFISGISISHKPYMFKLRYSENEWGPEDWHQSYGETFDRLYQAHISRMFGDHVTAGLEYTGARKGDNTAIELGDYDELRCFFTLSFGPLVAYTGAPPETGQQTLF